MSMSNTTKRIKEIRRKTRRKFSSEEKIRIVLDGLRSSLAAGLPTLISVTDYTADEDFTGAALVVNHFGDPGNPAAIIQNPGEIPFDRMVDLEVLKHVAHRIN